MLAPPVIVLILMSILKSVLSLGILKVSDIKPQPSNSEVSKVLKS